MKSFIKKLENYSDMKENFSNKVFYYKELQKYFNKDEYKRFWSLSPLTNHYYNPFNALFSYELDLIDYDFDYPVVLFRDGRIDLLEYFYKNPKPVSKAISKKVTFLIHDNLRDIVPKAWQKHVHFYSYSYKGKRKFDEFIIVGIFNNVCFSNDALKEKLINLKKNKKVNIKFCPLVRENLYSYNDPLDNTDLLNLVNTFCQESNRFQIIQEKDLLNLKNLDNCAYEFFFENDSFISDNFLEHYFLSKGACPLNQKDNNDFLFEYDLSPFHKINILDNQNVSEKSYLDFKNYVLNFKKKVQIPEHKDYLNDLVTYEKFFQWKESLNL